MRRKEKTPSHNPLTFWWFFKNYSFEDFQMIPFLLVLTNFSLSISNYLNENSGCLIKIGKLDCFL